jgi:hypothetical protein
MSENTKIKCSDTNGALETNWTTAPTAMQAKNVRGREAEFALDTHGFQLGTHKSAAVGFYGEQEIRDVYYAENVKLLQRLTGVTHVVLFDHSTYLR